MNPSAFLSDLEINGDKLRGCVRFEDASICMQTLFNQAILLLEEEKWTECSELCCTLLEFVWEKLNTGVWRDVAVSWRYLYSLGSLIKSISMAKNDLIASLKCCDKGLILGAPILDNILTKLAQNLHDRIVLTIPFEQFSPGNISIAHPQLNADSQIERIELPSVIDFQLDNYIKNKPVIITGLVKSWPGFNSWTLMQIRRQIGYRSVPIEIGSRYTDVDWTQKIMTVNEFMHRFMSDVGTEYGCGYLAQHQLFDQIPSLKEDILTPDYCFLNTCEEEDIDSNAWFGPGGTISPLHQDPRHNLLCQVMGSKYIRLYDVANTDKVYPLQDSIMSNTSQIDVENVDHYKFPAFDKTPFLNCILKPGEALFIPQGWWHFVKSLECSFSVSFWFD